MRQRGPAGLFVVLVLLCLSVDAELHQVGLLSLAHDDTGVDLLSDFFDKLQQPELMGLFGKSITKLQEQQPAIAARVASIAAQTQSTSQAQTTLQGTAGCKTTPLDVFSSKKCGSDLDHNHICQVGCHEADTYVGAQPFCWDGTIVILGACGGVNDIKQKRLLMAQGWATFVFTIAIFVFVLGDKLMPVFQQMNKHRTPKPDSTFWEKFFHYFQMVWWIILGAVPAGLAFLFSLPAFNHPQRYKILTAAMGFIQMLIFGMLNSHIMVLRGMITTGAKSGFNAYVRFALIFTIIAYVLVLVIEFVTIMKQAKDDTESCKKWVSDNSAKQLHEDVLKAFAAQVYASEKVVSARAKYSDKLAFDGDRKIIKTVLGTDSPEALKKQKPLLEAVISRDKAGEVCKPGSTVDDFAANFVKPACQEKLRADFELPKKADDEDVTGLFLAFPAVPAWRGIPLGDATRPACSLGDLQAAPKDTGRKLKDIITEPPELAAFVKGSNHRTKFLMQVLGTAILLTLLVPGIIIGIMAATKVFNPLYLD